jgi:hypothetical protein
MRKAPLGVAVLCVVSALAGAALVRAERPATISTDDFTEIQRLLYTNHTGYDFAMRDHGDMWTATFLPDAVLDNGPTHLVGERAIRQYALTPLETSPNRKFRHWTTTFQVSPNPEGAILSAFYLTIADTGANGGMTIGGTGRYESLVVKTKNGWRIKHHVVYGEGAVTARPEPARP